MADCVILASGHENLMKEHKRHFAKCDNLSYADQARSLTAQINTLSRSIMAHIRKASQGNRDPHAARLKCIAQVARLEAPHGQEAK